MKKPRKTRKRKLTPRQWIHQVFQAKSVRNGNIVRRKIASVMQYASLEAFEEEVKKRGFHMVQSGDQLVVLCNKGEFQLIC